MKTFPSFFRPLTQSFVATVLLSLSPLAAGQNQAGNSASDLPPPDAVAKRRIDKIEFREATLREATEFLQRKFPEVNLIIAEPPAQPAAPPSSPPIDPATGAPIPTAPFPTSSPSDVKITLSLHSATLEQALQAFGWATSGQVQVSEKEKYRTYVLSVSPNPASLNPQEATFGRVFSLSRYLDGKKGPEITQALNELREALNLAIGMIGRDTAATTPIQLELHAPTKLLIAVGNERQIAVVTQIVEALEATGRLAASSTPPNPPGVPPPSGLPFQPQLPGIPGGAVPAPPGQP